MSLQEIWQWISDRPLIWAFFALLVAMIAAKVVQVIFERVLHKMAARTHTDLDDKVLQKLRWPMQLSVFLAAALFIAERLMQEHMIMGMASSVIISGLILVWSISFAKISKATFKTLVRRSRGDSTKVQIFSLIDNLVIVALILGGGYLLLNAWKVNVTPLLASAGIATAAIALASKDTLANFFGGFSIFVDRPYRVGDYIVLLSGDRGEVVEIGVRSTRILTRDDVLITIPNAEMANRTIVNQSGQVPRYRFRIKVGVGYDSDPDVVEKALLHALMEVRGVLSYPAPRVRFREFGDSALVFELMAWISEPGLRGQVIDKTNRNIWRLFREHDIEIPYPHLTITRKQ